MPAFGGWHTIHSSCEDVVHVAKNRIVMTVLAININIPKDSAYNEAELRTRVIDYVNKLVAKKDVVLHKSNTSGFRKLRGIIQSDIPFEDMRREAIRDKYGV